MALWGPVAGPKNSTRHLCNLINLKDAEGYWQPGAIATLMDVVGVVAIMSIEDTMKVTVDLAISFFSQAKLHVYI